MISLNFELATACSYGNKEEVESLIKKGADDFNWALQHACYDGHLEIVKLLIEKGADDFNSGLKCAYYHDYMDIMILMINKGAIINSRFHLTFENIYYLLHYKITLPKQYSSLVNDCQKWKLEFENVANELFIKDVASIVSEY